MPMRNLPLNIWLVIKQKSRGTRVTLVSKHATEREAEAERDNTTEVWSNLTTALACSCSRSRNGWEDSRHPPAHARHLSRTRRGRQTPMLRWVLST
jgi:hypothetical protein